MDSCSLNSIMHKDEIQDGISMSSCFRLFSDAGTLSSYVPSTDVPTTCSLIEPNAQLAMQARPLFPRCRFLASAVDTGRWPYRSCKRRSPYVLADDPSASLLRMFVFGTMTS